MPNCTARTAPQHVPPALSLYTTSKPHHPQQRQRTPHLLKHGKSHLAPPTKAKAPAKHTQNTPFQIWQAHHVSPNQTPNQAPPPPSVQLRLPWYTSHPSYDSCQGACPWCPTNHRNIPLETTPHRRCSSSLKTSLSPTKKHSFTQEASGEAIPFFLKSGYIYLDDTDSIGTSGDQSVLDKLTTVHSIIAHPLICMIRQLSTYHFTWI